jgi:phosphoribosylformylglycinamidine synthase subunit PurSL
VPSQHPSWRLEIQSREAEFLGERLASRAHQVLGEAVVGLLGVHETTLYVVDRDLSLDERTGLAGAVVDARTQDHTWRSSDEPSPEGSFVEVALRTGVTDPTGEAFAKAANVLGFGTISARSGKRFSFRCAPGVAVEPIQAAVTAALLHNDIVDDVAFNTRIDVRFATEAALDEVEIVPVRLLSEVQLDELCRARGLALDPAELIAVQNFYRSIDRDPTDAELESIGQTWSEHCAHKTFRAHITWDDGTAITPLLRQLRNSTDTLAKPWVVSAFVDNAGIIAFDDAYDIAIKVETHNHPSAIEPFGGANTGVGGVIRDVLGVAADAIAVTNILCFGPTDTRTEDLPKGVLHPQRIRDGVISGIADYGNKIGLPTVAGAIVHQEGFTANPLVFAGCIGLRPAGLKLRGPIPGDRIIAIGGATGRDGVRGATFSSLTMDATTGDVAGASVQIGDPIIEKLVSDVLTEARDAGLFVGITDCGAGGFSSAIGEIAAELGADVNLDAAPLKYPGLAPWEVWLSEAQERMVLAVPADSVAALQTICDAHEVSMADLGAFRSDGQLIVRYAGKTLLDLPGSFLHDGRPARQMTASRPAAPPTTGERDYPAIVADATAILRRVLAHPDVRSNESVVRGYDHEILGGTIGRPFVGVHNDGPADAAVISPLKAPSGRGLAIGIGMNCRTGMIDAKLMAGASIDEAIRNVVAVGADPRQIALLDNFSWGDPRKPATLGQLVEAVEACCEGAASFSAPFVSGKDSLNNEYLTTKGERTSIPPTLVITALGILQHGEKLITSDAKSAGNALVLVGPAGTDLRGSVLDSVLGIDAPGTVPGADSESPARYLAVHRAMVDGLVLSAHDCSDGGLLTTVTEMAIGGRLGASVVLRSSNAEVVVGELFSETSGRLVLETTEANVQELCTRTGGSVIGHLHAEPSLSVTALNGSEIVQATLDDLRAAWQSQSTSLASSQTAGKGATA